MDNLAEDHEVVAIAAEVYLAQITFRVFESVGDEEYFIFIHDTGLRLAGFRGLVYLEPWRENIRNVHYFILTPERRAKIDCLAEVQFADGQFHVQKIVRNDARLPEGARAPD